MTATGDADLSVVAAALGDRGRARMVLAVTDGRALPASTLAGEAGVSAATASAHLRRLVDAGVLRAEQHGRFRYFRLAGPEVADLVEALGRVSPPQPVRSLKEGTRAHALRLARACYDHVAGRLGVALTDALLDAGHLVGGDGADSGRRDGDRLPGLDVVDYSLSADGRTVLTGLDVAVPDAAPVRCCVDWTEQRHHVAGPLGRALLTTMTDRGWVRPARRSRALTVTDEGRTALVDALGLVWPPPHGPDRVPGERTALSRA
ncbi:ArsR/SmtB family transcription factor [Actinomycetospora termitidis]|uniref:Helix-turn-helix domain-containing protein n=1 Tax=Actinomycetospora termitidis TaxID=3053470 RepID=A0ABT7MAG0_9PSEU|nr:helix-turn-helix domain-containing protein [Actinomycetospora sp. Odt1-22]MDL5157640.1 helix-turn-helix domain-containing protein [Actinomycetospora sp. Odt1-22]